MIGCMSGNLIGLKLDFNKPFPNSEVMYTTEQKITCIKTARVSSKAQTYYVIMSDTSGFIYVLKGFGSEPLSYKLFVKLNTYVEIHSICTNPMIYN